MEEYIKYYPKILSDDDMYRRWVHDENIPDDQCIIVTDAKGNKYRFLDPNKVSLVEIITELNKKRLEVKKEMGK